MTSGYVTLSRTNNQNYATVDPDSSIRVEESGLRYTNENQNMTPEQRDDWTQVSFSVEQLSSRPGHLPQPGGALNANYTQVDAIALVSAKCGELGLKYNEDFTWETASYNKVIFRLKDDKYKTMLGLSL